MEFNYRAVDERATSHTNEQLHPPTRYNCSAAQATRGVHSAEVMRRKHEYFQSPNIVREAIHRELKKERIREELIAENARRRALEDEVRRDLRTERGLVLCGRGEDEVGRFRAGMGVTVADEPSLEERIARTVEERIVTSLEGRIVMSLERSGIVERIAKTVEERIVTSLAGRIAMAPERLGKVARGGLGEQLLVPLVRGSVEPKIAEVVHRTVEFKKEAKPDSNLYDAKPPPLNDVGELTSTGVAKKILNEDWSCALCKVGTTSKRALDDHVRGKKHQAKEAALRSENKRKNSDQVLPRGKKAMLTSLQ